LFLLTPRCKSPTHRIRLFFINVRTVLYHR